MGLALVAVLRPWPLPQGQRKELPGPAGKGSRPRMEENELYSSTAAGEGLPLLGRLCREGLWASAAADSSCPVVAPSPGQPPYQPLCIASGRPSWGSLACPECQAFSRGSGPVPWAPLRGEGEAGGGGVGVSRGAPSEPSGLLCLRMVLFLGV